MVNLIQGDCLEEMRKLPDNSVDSVVTDPPYELGFMGKSWDNTGIANNPLMWAEALRVLKPGGYLLSFGGTRTYHRMAAAIEDAGFEVRDMIEWVYGSGFPKSLNIGKAVDKLQGNEREVVGTQMLGGNAAQSTKEKGGTYASNTNAVGVKPIEINLTKGTSEYEGWGTALKPAHEPICMARKPLAEKTVAENVLKYGTGGINIDESRVGMTEQDRAEVKAKANKKDTTNNIIKGFGNNTAQFGDWEMSKGRFPANLIHDNSEEVRECFPNESERFFKSIIYQAKASKSERNKGCEGLEEKPVTEFSSGGFGNENATATFPMLKNNHPTVKPIALMEYLIKMVTPKGGVVLDPFMGSGSTGVAAKQNGYGFIGIDMTPEYIEIAKARIENCG